MLCLIVGESLSLDEWMTEVTFTSAVCGFIVQLSACLFRWCISGICTLHVQFSNATNLHRSPPFVHSFFHLLESIFVCSWKWKCCITVIIKYPSGGGRFAIASASEPCLEWSTVHAVCPYVSSPGHYSNEMGNKAHSGRYIGINFVGISQQWRIQVVLVNLLLALLLPDILFNWIWHTRWCLQNKWNGDSDKIPQFAKCFSLPMKRRNLVQGQLLWYLSKLLNYLDNLRFRRNCLFLGFRLLFIATNQN